LPSAATIRREVKELRKMVEALKTEQSNPVLDELRNDPSLILTKAGMAPDPWQAKLLRSHSSRILMNASRQSGKSQTAAALALKVALLEPGSLVLLLSPTLRQSGELFRDKFKRLYNALGRPVATKQESALSIELVNNSRVISLPGDEGTIRGYSSVALLVVDEASRVTDDLYATIRPMLAVSQGSLIAMSTPWGRTGWFYSAWHSDEPWEKVFITADMCPRISAEFLEEEKRAMPERFFRQEFFGEFLDTLDQVFRSEDLELLSVNAPPPLWS
jgi:hypothetical protein